MGEVAGHEPSSTAGGDGARLTPFVDCAATTTRDEPILDTPLTFDPILVPKPWGGDRLRRFGRAVDEGARIGESWDIADLAPDTTSVPDPVSRIRGGDLAGRALADVIATDPESLLGTARPTRAGRFPLLVKLLDARETLSVQVHPPASIAPDSYKTESWVVVDAEPGAELLLGVTEGVTLDEVVAVMGTADLLPLLRRVPVEVGDVVHLPAGTIHALGAGVLVAEVQTTSDTTYRVWDWPDERDGGRELHVAEARAAVTAGWEHNRSVAVDRPTDGTIVDCEPYELEHVTVAPGRELTAAARRGTPRVLLLTSGSLSWRSTDDRTELAAGGVALLPAASSTAVTAGQDGATVVVATPH